MKQELIDKLFNQLDKDKEAIKRNLLEVMDYIIIETHNKYGRLVMTLEYKQNKEKEDDANGQTKSN